MAPNAFLPIATFVNFVSAVFTLIIWYTAYRAFRFLGSVKMLFLSISFLLFSLGLFSQTFYATAALVESIALPRLFVGEGYLLYSILMLAGYMVLAFAYSIGEVGAAALSVFAYRKSPFNSVTRLFFNFRFFFRVRRASVLSSTTPLRISESVRRVLL